MLRALALLAALPIAAAAQEDSPIPEGMAHYRVEVMPQGSFSMRWGADVAALPALVADLAFREEELLRTARGYAREQARDAGPGEHLPETEVRAEARITARSGDVSVVELSSYHYLGGAHGMTAIEPLLFDRTRGLVLPAGEVLNAEFSEPARAAFCTRLGEMQAERRGRPRPADDVFGGCPEFSETRPFPAGPGPFDSVTFSVPPYVAGPYAEGFYDVDLPITRAMLQGIASDWRGVFAASQ